MSDNEQIDISTEIVVEGPCRQRLKCEIPVEKVKEEFDGSFAQLRKTIQLPGFRKGKAPRAVLERKFGKQVADDVKDELMQTTFEDTIRDQELKVLGQPAFENVQFSQGEPFSYEAVFDIYPTFELGEYTGLEVEAEPVVVPESDIDEELERIQQAHTTAEVIDAGTQAAEDLATVELAMMKDGEAVFTEPEANLKIGEDKIDAFDVEGLSAFLEGAEIGAQNSFEVDIPEDFPNDDMKGQRVEMTLEVKGFKRLQKPDLDDEFAGKFDLESMDAMREQVQKSIEGRRELEEHQRQEEILVQKVADAIDMELPESIIEKRTKELQLGKQMRLMREGLGEEEVAVELAKDEESKDAARKEIKQVFILERIAEKERVFVTEDEIGRRIYEIAMTYQRDFNEVLEEYRQRNMLPELRAGLQREKVRTLLREKAKVLGLDTDVDDEAASGDDGAPEAE